MAAQGGTKAVRSGARWSARTEQAFLVALADSCNVTRSARIAGVSVSSAYRRRATQATFRARWGEALSTGYAQLELMLLERALHGVEKVVKVDGESRTIREYCDRTALTLLKMHRDTVGEIDGGVDAQHHAEATERILVRLQRLRGQLTGAAETKAGCDRLALLAAVLKLRRAERV